MVTAPALVKCAALEALEVQLAGIREFRGVQRMQSAVSLEEDSHLSEITKVKNSTGMLADS